MALEIRTLEAADAAAFHALRLRGLVEFPEAFASSYEEEAGLDTDYVAKRLAPEPGHAVYGAFVDDRLAGILGLRREDRVKLRHKALIWGVYVAPEFRKRGIARKLMEHALAAAFSWDGVLQVNLGVNAANPAARALYESVGFEAFGLEKACMMVNGKPQDEVTMVCVRGD